MKNPNILREITQFTTVTEKKGISLHHNNYYKDKFVRDVMELKFSLLNSRGAT